MKRNKIFLGDREGRERDEDTDRGCWKGVGRWVGGKSEEKEKKDEETKRERQRERERVGNEGGKVDKLSWKFPVLMVLAKLFQVSVSPKI